MFKLRVLISLQKDRNVKVFGVTMEESRCTTGDRRAVHFYCDVFLSRSGMLKQQSCESLLCLPLEKRNGTGCYLNSETSVMLSCVRKDRRNLVLS
jgi:hypothetical protein